MKFHRDFDPSHGAAVAVAPGVLRLTAPNANAFTFTGTNSYLIGEVSCCLIDPGPDLDAHFEVVMDTLRGRRLTHIALTHTHMDHVSLTKRLQEATGAITVSGGPHRLCRPLYDGEVNPIAQSADWVFQPDLSIEDSSVLSGQGWELEAIATPGHAANHIAYGLRVGDQRLVFSGDHVMAWATSVVVPPDGSMRLYMDSLEKMLHRDDHILFPGHGGPVAEPNRFIKAIKAHRQLRERAIFECVKEGDLCVDDIVKRLYRDTDKRLLGAASFSVLAHLEALTEKEMLRWEGVFGLSAMFYCLDSAMFTSS